MKLSKINKEILICLGGGISQIPLIKAAKKKMSIGSSGSYERKRIAGKKKVNAFRDGFLILFCMLKLFLLK